MGKRFERVKAFVEKTRKNAAGFTVKMQKVGDKSNVYADRLERAIIGDFRPSDVFGDGERKKRKRKSS